MFNLWAAATMLLAVILIVVPLQLWLYAKHTQDTARPCCEKHAPQQPVVTPKPEPENETDRAIREIDQKLSQPDMWRWTR